MLSAKGALLLSALITILMSFFASDATADTTFVSGTIHSNTTWTSAGNPYMIIGQTRVDTNIVLTISPGVIIKFNVNLGLTIDGALKALGTSLDSIIFTSSGQGDWSNLVFSNSSIDSICTLEYCRLDGSSYGLIFEAASPAIRYCNITNNGGVGYDASGPALRIMAGSAPVIFGNTIKSNQQVWQGTGERYGGGIDIQPGSSPLIIGNVIDSNSVSSWCTFGDCGAGWGGGICIRSDSAIVVGNKISGNHEGGGFNRICGGGGIAVIDCSPLIDCNEITSNVGQHGGAIFIYSGNPVITCNFITGNSAEGGGVNAGGIFAYGGEGVFSLNNIYANHSFVNSIFEVYAGSVGAGQQSLYMANNWWGTTNVSEIDLLVYDFWDDPNLRRIEYLPYAQAECSPVNDSMVVLFPNGGEELQSDGIFNIRWNPFCFTDNVNIDYSLDSGVTWENIVSDVRNYGSYAWTVPYGNSEACKVRVTDALDSQPGDVSDNYFTICSVQTIAVTFPNGGENLFADSIYNVTWVNHCFTSRVNADYSIDSGISWAQIASNIANSGSMEWTVPHAPSSNCMIRISDYFDGCPYDVSDAVFSIIKPIICGDASGNDLVNIQDIAYLINYLYKGGPAPNPPEAGDANGNGILNIQDITYLINYLYKGGPAPICP